jgi:hypothetical protein
MDRHIGRRITSSLLGSRRWLTLVGLGLVAISSLVFAAEPCGTGSYPFPYTDVAGVGDPFCPGIMEAYVTGISKGTTATTFSPNDTVIRLQMTTFLQRALDQGLTRASRRAALNQWWTPQDTGAMQTITLAGAGNFCASDGENIWTTDSANRVAQIEASTGTNLNHWTGATNPRGVVVAAGKVFVAGSTSPGSLYLIDPTQPPGAVTVAANTLGNNPIGIAFDGTNVWTANGGGSVSIISPQSPYTVTTVSTGFTAPEGIVFDGAHIWVTDVTAGTLLKLNSSGGIMQTVTVGAGPDYPVFDGTNIWVPNGDGISVTVVQASSGSVVATIPKDANNQFNGLRSASFDGERILVTNEDGFSITLFKAVDLSFIANIPTGSSSNPFGACSDGVNFWITTATGLLRF